MFTSEHLFVTTSFYCLSIQMLTITPKGILSSSFTKIILCSTQPSSYRIPNQHDLLLILGRGYRLASIRMEDCDTDAVSQSLAHMVHSHQCSQLPGPYIKSGRLPRRLHCIFSYTIQPFCLHTASLGAHETNV